VSAIPLHHLERARNIGTAVHIACELLDQDDLDFDSIDPAILGYIVGYQQFREEYQFKPELIEHAMIGEVNELRYGMRFDRLGTVHIKGVEERVLLDLKTASKPSPSWPIQTAAYLVGYSAVDEGSRPRRAVVHLVKDATYRVLYHTLDSDFDIWSSALTVAHWRIANGTKIK
jgi:hypothetical protein